MVRTLPDKDEKVRRAAVSALGQIDDPQASGALIAQYHREKSVPVRRDIVESLGVLKAETATPLLIKAAEDPYIPLRIAALKSLNQIGSPDGHAAIVQALKDDADGVRLTALRAAQERPMESDVETIRESLHFPNADVRLEAVKAIAAVKASGGLKEPSKELRTELSQLSVKDPDSRVKESAAALLQEWK